MSMPCHCRGGPDCCLLQRMPQVQLPPVIIEKHFYRSFDPPIRPTPYGTPIKPLKQWMPPDGEAMRAEDV